MYVLCGCVFEFFCRTEGEGLAGKWLAIDTYFAQVPDTLEYKRLKDDLFPKRFSKAVHVKRNKKKEKKMRDKLAYMLSKLEDVP